MSYILLEINIPIKTPDGVEHHSVQAFIRKRWYGTDIEVLSTYSEPSCKTYDYEYENVDRLRAAKKYLREVGRHIVKMDPKSATRFCLDHKIRAREYKV